MAVGAISILYVLRQKLLTICGSPSNTKKKDASHIGNDNGTSKYSQWYAFETKSDLAFTFTRQVQIINYSAIL